MKRLIYYFIAFVFVLVNSGVSLATPSASKTLGVSLTIPPKTPELDINILKITDGDPDKNPWTNSTDVTSTMTLDFGTLIPDFGVSHWFSTTYYCVIIFTQGFGTQYEVKSKATWPTTPYDYLALTPVYSEHDSFKLSDGTLVEQGPMPAGASMPFKDTSVSVLTGGETVVYTSEKPSTPRILQAYYSMPTYAKGSTTPPFPSWKPLPLTIAPQTFTGGTITISIVAK